MKKLRLEDIKVDSYTTETVAHETGTVQGNMATLLRCAPTGPIQCPQPTLDPSCESGVYCC